MIKGLHVAVAIAASEDTKRKLHAKLVEQINEDTKDAWGHLVRAVESMRNNEPAAVTLEHVNKSQEPLQRIKAAGALLVYLQ